MNWEKNRERIKQQHEPTTAGKDESRPIVAPPRNVTKRPLRLPEMKPIKGARDA